MTIGSVAPSGAETITAQAPGARVAVYIEGGVAASSFTVARQLGVVSVTNPSVGIFCIKPVSSVSTAKIVPTVSTEYENTEGWDWYAMWSSSRTVCPSRTIQVSTFDSSAEALINQVAFTLVVDCVSVLRRSVPLVDP